MENIVSLPPPSPPVVPLPPTQVHHYQHPNRRLCISHSMEALVGTRLLREITPERRRSRASYLADGFNEGPTIKTDIALANKDLVLLYFSGGWCASCREFTSLLVEFYHQAKHNKDEEDNNNSEITSPGTRTRWSMKDSSKIEVIYVSADRDVGEFQKYYSRMPWLACDYHSEHCKTSLTRKCHIGRIPTVVVLDAKTGYYVTDRGCDDIRQAMLHVHCGSAVESLIEKWETAEAVPLNQASFSKGACIIL